MKMKIDFLLQKLEPITFFFIQSQFHVQIFDFFFLFFLYIVLVTFPGNLCRYIHRTDQMYFQTDKPSNRYEKRQEVRLQTEHLSTSNRV